MSPSDQYQDRAMSHRARVVQVPAFWTRTGSIPYYYPTRVKLPFNKMINQLRGYVAHNVFFGVPYERFSYKGHL